MSLFYLRSTDPELLGRLLAYNRVERGIVWLHKNAPPKWWLRFFHLTVAGAWVCRADDTYENECAISIAFETEPKYADSFGYVIKPILLSRLKLRDERRRKDRARMFGFSSDFSFVDLMRMRNGGTAKPGQLVTSKMLDMAWSDCVLRVYRNRQFTPRHYSMYDRAIDRDMDGVMESLRRFLRPTIIDRLRRFGRRIHATQHYPYP